jgi:fibro-slime domain-containing protein
MPKTKLVAVATVLAGAAGTAITGTALANWHVSAAAEAAMRAAANDPYSSSSSSTMSSGSTKSTGRSGSTSSTRSSPTNSSSTTTSGGSSKDKPGAKKPMTSASSKKSADKAKKQSDTKSTTKSSSSSSSKNSTKQTASKSTSEATKSSTTTDTKVTPPKPVEVPAEDAGQISITGVIRDFKTDHPDFETYPDYLFKGFNQSDGVYLKLVDERLDPEGKPTFNRNLLKSRSWSDIPLTSEEHLAQWFRDVPGVNTSFPHTITLQREGSGAKAKYVFAREKPNYFFPADGKGFGNSTGPLRWADEGSHNFHFTYELETQFTYLPRDQRDYDLVFSFTGDDDVWVFINGHLVVDIGGVHSQAKGSVNVDTEASRLGLQPFGTYTLKLFFAERHTSQSNFRIETTLRLRPVEPPPTRGLYD